MKVEVNCAPWQGWRNVRVGVEMWNICWRPQAMQLDSEMFGDSRIYATEVEAVRQVSVICFAESVNHCYSFLNVNSAGVVCQWQYGVTDVRIAVRDLFSAKYRQ